MPEPIHQPRSLLAAPIGISGDDFKDIQGWQYPDEPFFIRQVRLMLLRDIPQLVMFGNCTIWKYVDPLTDMATVGLGTMTLSQVHMQYTESRRHPYIPLLSVRPNIPSFGYGQSIVDHLVAEAALMVRQHGDEIADTLLLDVYKANEKAYRLYSEKCHFVNLTPDSPTLDPDENNEPYYVMGRRVS